VNSPECEQALESFKTHLDKVNMGRKVHAGSIY